MPAPRQNDIPDSENWKPVQRFPDVTQELKPLARNLVAFNGQEYANLKSQILSFLSGTDAEKSKKWSDFWIIIIHTLGLAYTTSIDNNLHTTKFAKYISRTIRPDSAIFLYWALKYQFPWAQNKHREWKEIGKRVQPIVFVLRHLVAIFEKKLSQGEYPFEHTYLTYEEIILVLMKSYRSDIYAVYENVNLILERREVEFDYNILKENGYELLENQFANRTRRFIEMTGLIRFDNQNERVFLNSWKTFLSILTFLSYAKKPIQVTTNELSRIRLFEEAFNTLDPHPNHLFMAITRTRQADEIESSNFDFPRLIHANLLAQGYSYDEDFIEAFCLSLKTKPFLILSGISGTGKTALPRAIMTMVRNENCKPIAVAPDWTDNTDMLGYFNVENEFIIGEFTTLVREATNNREVPYFVILDEMNLARVEYYFAQVLSVIESRKFNEDIDDVEYGDYLFNKALRDRLINEDENEIANLKIPSNLYIIGTVNIDETTHPFSKKVLDRANVLEINDVDLMQGLQLVDNDDNVPNIPAINYFFKGNITNITELQKHWSLNNEIDLPMIETLTVWINRLSDFNEILKASRMNFGFRVRDEVCIYLYHAAILNTERPRSENWWNKYFDQQLIQKVLTRFSGEQNQVETHIINLFNQCLQDGVYDQDQITDADMNGDDNIIFPKTARKLQLMLREVVNEDKPSTSFWTV